MPSVIGKAGNVLQGGTIIFVSDYFDFVRVRNWVKGQVGGDGKVGFISEYTEGRDISRWRGAFFRGECGVLVVTERFHFFRRFVLLFVVGFCKMPHDLELLIEFSLLIAFFFLLFLPQIQTSWNFTYYLLRFTGFWRLLFGVCEYD